MELNGTYLAGAFQASPQRFAQARAHVAAMLEGKLAQHSRVAIAVADHAAFVTAALAVRDVGAVAVLLCSNARPRRGELEERLAVADVDLVIADEVHATHLGLAEEGVFELELATPGLSLHVLRRSSDPSENPQGAAWIAFTSGSEAAPKAVVHRQSAIDFMLEINQFSNRWREGDTLLSALPLSHLAGFINLLGALSQGVRAVECPSFMWPVRVMAACAENEVTVVGLVPYYFGRMVQHPAFASLERLRLAILSAAPVVEADVALARQKLPGLELANAYGLTEAFRSTFLPPERSAKLPSIGRPVPGVEVRLEPSDDAAGEGQGVALIRGPNVMIGYWGLPERTAEVLSDGWFRTADIMHVDEEGDLWVDGRTDDTINGAGEKLSSRVLEEILLSSCGVDEVFVLPLRTGESRDRIVVVVAAPKGQAVPDLEQIRSACAAHVHAVFLPDELHHVDALPRNRSGKLDRPALRSLIQGREPARPTRES